MNLGDLHAEVKASIRRGDSMDALIPGFVRKGVRWIERNKTLQYMKQFSVITLDPVETSTPEFIEIEGTGIKEVFLFRWVSQTGEYIKVRRIDPGELFGKLEGIPTAYWLDGVSRLVLSAKPTTILNGELYLSKYSTWPISLTATHWLLDFAEDVLFHSAMANFGKHARDADIAAFHKNEALEALTTLMNAEIDSTNSNSDDAFGEQQW